MVRTILVVGNAGIISISSSVVDFFSAFTLMFLSLSSVLTIIWGSSAVNEVSPLSPETLEAYLLPVHNSMSGSIVIATNCVVTNIGSIACWTVLFVGGTS